MPPRLLDKRKTLRPFKYPWAIEAWETQQAIAWLPKEVNMAGDILDWNKNMTPDEIQFITTILKFFTQADVDVHDCYAKNYMTLFGSPEIVMMLTAFANMETVHVQGYSYLLDSLGFGDDAYSSFLEYDEMVAKHDFLSKYKMDTNHNIAVGIAVYAGFVEGLQLFASFIMLLHFSRSKKLRGMATIIEWSIRDESLHVASMIKLFKTFCLEYNIPVENVSTELLFAVEQAIKLEDSFIDLAFKDSVIEGLTPEDVKGYIRYIANIRLKDLGVPYSVGGAKILPWANAILNSPVHTNFFEERTTDYSRASTRGEWGDCFKVELKTF